MPIEEYRHSIYNPLKYKKTARPTKATDEGILGWNRKIELGALVLPRKPIRTEVKHVHTQPAASQIIETKINNQFKYKDSNFLEEDRLNRYIKLNEKQKSSDGVNIIEIQLETPMKSIRPCTVGTLKDCKFKSRGTQSLYRESSQQTLPYLPTPSAETEETYLELFKMPKLIPKAGPPTIYEVELVERARKRWSFMENLANIFQAHTDKMKQYVSKFKDILNSFEWEDWLARENYIQKCQMLRLEYVIRMFNKREKEMLEIQNEHTSFRCQKICNEMKVAKEKNRLRYERDIRRIESTFRSPNMFSCPEYESVKFSDPDADLVKYHCGADPRVRNFRMRHFIPPSQKAYNERMTKLENRVIKMSDLLCPFKRLQTFVKPKVTKKNVSRSFKKERDIAKFYDELKYLHMKQHLYESRHSDVMPGFIREKSGYGSRRGTAEMYEISNSQMQSIDTEHSGSDDEEIQPLATKSTSRIKSERETQKGISKIYIEKEEIQNMQIRYEAATINWIWKEILNMEARIRIKQKLQILSRTAFAERLTRENNEDFTRKCEQEIRKLFQSTYYDVDAGEQYVAAKECEDIKQFGDEIVHNEPANRITELSKTIDKDLRKWIQLIIGDNTSINPIELIKYRIKESLQLNFKSLHDTYKKEQIIEHIIENVLFTNINDKLEVIDMSQSIVNDTIDRAIGNDLYLISTEDLTKCQCGPECEACAAIHEAEAIIRKLIRKIIPGRNWITADEANEELNMITKQITETFAGVKKPGKKCNCICRIKLANLLSDNRRDGENEQEREQKFGSTSFDSRPRSSAPKDSIDHEVSTLYETPIPEETIEEEQLTSSDVTKGIISSMLREMKGDEPNFDTTSFDSQSRWDENQWTSADAVKGIVSSILLDPNFYPYDTESMSHQMNEAEKLSKSSNSEFELVVRDDGELELMTKADARRASLSFHHITILKEEKDNPLEKMGATSFDEVAFKIEKESNVEQTQDEDDDSLYLKQKTVTEGRASITAPPSTTPRGTITEPRDSE